MRLQDCSVTGIQKMQTKHKLPGSIWGSQERLIAEEKTTFSAKGRVGVREAEKGGGCERISSGIDEGA